MDELLQQAYQVPGEVSGVNLAMQLQILKYLKEKNLLHNTFETGCFFGRTAKIPVELGAKHISVDHTAQPTYTHENWTVIKKDSKYVSENEFSELLGKVDFMLIDGEHSCRAALSDLRLANKLVSETGFLVVDDTTPFFSGIEEALYTFLKEEKDSFIPLIKTDSETVLCRAHSWEEYYNFVLLELPKKIIESDESLKITIHTGDSDEQNYCFVKSPFIKILPNWQQDKKLVYRGNAPFNTNPNTFPIIERKNLSSLNID